MNKRKLKLMFTKLWTSNLRTEITVDERNIIRIVRKLLNEPETEPLLNPLLSEYYLENPIRDMLVIINIDNDEITIINGVYCYIVKLSARVLNVLIKDFENVVTNRREEIKAKYASHITNNLENVIKKLENN